ncbi:MAG TPA: copper resistance protein CopC [Solirubrobacteraceae bacterium]
MALVGVAAIMLLAPAAASAHAYLITTSPAIGAVVPSSPAQVSLTYDEAVTVNPGALEVYDAAGKRVDDGGVRHPTPPTITVAIPERLSRGTYTVAWRVTSADTHVVHGVFTFSVGARGNAGAIGARLAARGQIPAVVSTGFGVVRFLNLLLLLLCGGGAAAVVLLLRDAGDRTRRRLLRWLVVGGALLAVMAVLGLPFEAAEANGTGLGGGFAVAALASVRGIRFGQVWLVRAWLAVAFALLALVLQVAGNRRRVPGEVLLIGVAFALLLTPSAAGHANVAGSFAFVVDAAHVLAAAAWLGGLVFVLGALAISAPADRWPVAIRSVPRLSLLATGAVGVLLMAGVINALIEVSAVRGLWQSTYGELILAKIALALPLLALGAFNNRVSVPGLLTGAPPPELRARFLRVASAEVALLVVVVGVTAALIAEAPAKDLLAQTTSITATHAIGPFSASVVVSPGAVGANTIDVSVHSSARRPPMIGEVDLAADPPTASSLAPLNLDVIQVSPTRFRVASAPLARAGTWHLDATVRVGLTEWLARIPIRIRAA